MGDVIRGPWPDRPPQQKPPTAEAALSFRWIGRTRTAETRRDYLIASRPCCSICEAPYDRKYRVPPDGICRRCRRDLDNNTSPDDPALF